MYPVAVVLHYTIQYNTIHNKHKIKTQNNTYTLKTIHNQNNTQRNNYKHDNTNTMHERKQKYKAI